MKIVSITPQKEAEMWDDPELRDKITYINKDSKNLFGIRSFVLEDIFYLVYDRDSIVMKTIINYVEENRARAEGTIKNIDDIRRFGKCD